MGRCCRRGAIPAWGFVFRVVVSAHDHLFPPPPVSIRLIGSPRIAATILAFLAIVGLASFPSWHDEEAGDDDPEGSVREPAPYPSRMVSLVVFASLIIVGLLQLVCSLWQHVASTAASSVGGVLQDDAVQFHIGRAQILDHPNQVYIEQSPPPLV